jgi:hypothetical protein
MEIGITNKTNMGIFCSKILRGVRMEEALYKNLNIFVKIIC